MPAGRPIEFSQETIKKSKRYLEECKDTFENKKLKVNLPSIEGLSLYLGVSKDSIYRWEKQYPEFSDVISELRNIQVVRLLNMGLSGDYSPFISKALLSKHGYSEKQEVNQNTTITIKYADEVNSLIDPIGDNN